MLKFILEEMLWVGFTLGFDSLPGCSYSLIHCKLPKGKIPSEQCNCITYSCHTRAPCYRMGYAHCL